MIKFYELINREKSIFKRLELLGYSEYGGMDRKYLESYLLTLSRSNRSLFFYRTLTSLSFLLGKKGPTIQSSYKESVKDQLRGETADCIKKNTLLSHHIFNPISEA